MQTIWKFDLQLADRQVVKMPLGAAILSIDTRGDDPKLWALVDDKEPNIGNRIFHVVREGHPCPGLVANQFFASVQAGGFVWHFFDLGWE